MKRFTIGIDIGGTNTDGVLIDNEGRLVAAYKITTTEPLVAGFSTLLQMVCSGIEDRSTIQSVHIGTTHTTNALLEARGLLSVGIIRIAPEPLIISCCAGWPNELIAAIKPLCVTVRGGYECDGRASAKLSECAIRTAIETLLSAGVGGIAIIGTFSPLFKGQERQVYDLVRSYSATIPVTCSADIGGIGFVDRENATIMNVALAASVGSELDSLESAIRMMGIEAKIRISQNDGTLMSAATAREFPVRMVSAGPTNSAVGGALSAGVHDAVVVDIGGTSTDVMIVLDGVPRKSFKNSSIAAVSLNTRMPDLLSIALGGGSIITGSTIGPQSVARSLHKRAQIFGGSICTLTDVACLLDYCSIPDADITHVTISKSEAQNIMESAAKRIDHLITQMRGIRDMPAVLVGGGASLFPEKLFNNSVIVPHCAGVANAIGAAHGKISTTVDMVVSLSDRQSTLIDLRGGAIEAVYKEGARAETATIIDEQIIPYAYIPGNQARVIITAAGNAC